MALIRAIFRPVRLLCTRELQNTLQDSVHQLLVDQIQILGISRFFDIYESRIHSKAGAEFMFKGLRGMRNDATQLKSLEGVDICWIEEGQTVGAASLQTLAPTIRKPNAEIWITLNPDQETDPVYQLVKHPPESAIVRKVNYDSNPWFESTSLPAEMEWMRRTDPEAYAHVWLGECRRYSEAQVLRGKYSIESFTPGADWDGPYFGADWGFASDPTALVKLWISERRLYVEYEAYGIGVEIDHLPAMFDSIPGSRSHVIRADSARPETISYMRRAGFNVRAAKKGPGSVEDGVAHLRGYESIIIHPRCIHAAEEARLWSYKVDRLSGDVLPVLAEGNEHIWDGIRYSLEPVIKPAYQGPRGLSVSGL
jgi:phage terminase large subunit